MAGERVRDVFIISTFFTMAFCKVYLPEGVPEVNRKILGSNGPFRDFDRSDCRASFQNSWSQCDNPSFIYHWNYMLKGCERAIYKGCGATRNNFLTLRDCEKQAGPVCNRGGFQEGPQINRIVDEPRKANLSFKRNVEVTDYESGAPINKNAKSQSEQEKLKKLREDTKSFIENEQKNCRKW